MVVEAAEAAGQEIEEAEVSRPDPDSRTVVEAEQLLQHPASIRGLNTQTYPQVSGQGARCIIAGDDLLIFVQSHRLVLGRTFTLRNLQNEVLTSSSIHLT